MKKILGLKSVIGLTFVIMLIGSIVFTFGFGSTIYLARQEVLNETNQQVDLAISSIQTYVDDQLQRVEDVGYTFLCNTFAGTSRSESADALVTVDPSKLKIPSEEEVFNMLEQFINANPHICGVAVAFEPFLYKENQGRYGFGAYVTNVSGKNERIKLGNVYDYREWEWYKDVADTDEPHWTSPFMESSMNKVVAGFCVPLHGYGNRFIGVMALDIDTEAFHHKCNSINLFPGAEVSLVDSKFRFISHSNPEYILESVGNIPQYANYTSDDSMRVKMLNHQSGQYTVNKGTDQEAIFYFAPITRTGWTISIECPIKDIYRNVQKMRRTTSWIATFCMLFMILCFILLFRRMKSVTTSKAGIERDLQIASAIQMGMLPKLYPAFPEHDDIDVYGFLKPAKSVGGDLYDYFIRDEKLFFCIGDVSGKGVPASLFMAVIRALFRNISLHADDPAYILSALNKALSDGNTHNMFCTMFLGILDLKTGDLDFCNGGHNAPVIRRVNPDGSVRVYFAEPEINIAVGVFDGFEYKKQHTLLHPGEAIFLYTDGVTEAENASKVLFGEDMTLKALAEARNHDVRSAKDFVEFVYAKVQEHAHGTEQSDDITMVVVEYKGDSKAKNDPATYNDVLHLKNNISNIPTLAEWVDGFAEQFSLPADQVFQLNLALEEAVVNVMNYAYPGQEGMPVDISCHIKDNLMTFTIDDQGVPFDPTQKEDPDITLSAEDRPIGGLGILLVRQIMKDIIYERKDGHNILTLTMEISELPTN